MKLLSKKAWITITAAFALGAGILGATDLVKPQPNFEVGAAAVQTHRRVYVVLEGDWQGGVESDMYIHYWGGAVGTDWNNCPKMDKVVSDYSQGLFFYDVPIDTTTFMVKRYAGGVADWEKTVDIPISSLFLGTDFKAAAIPYGTTPRSAKFYDNLPSNSGQTAAVLAAINSCSTCYAGGCNAWPQLDDLFISCSTLDYNTTVYDRFGANTTIANKVAWLQTKYNIDQASPVLIFNEEKRYFAVSLTLGAIGLTLIGALYLTHRRKTV